MLAGLQAVYPPQQLTAVVNTGDDTELHGLHISPDLDTVTYTLGGVINTETGWGLQSESWQAMEILGRYGGVTWFNLGDRDLGTHLYRTHRLGQGATLSQITTEITRAWDVAVQVVPMSDDTVRTMVTVETDGATAEIGFQDYFVRHRHALPVNAVRFEGADSSAPAPGVLDAISSADGIVVAPSNPIVSIGPVLAVPGIRDAVAARREDAVAVSPIIAGAALKGPADRLLEELGHESSVVGIARFYAELIGTLVVDEADEASVDAVEREGVRCIVAPTIMSDADRAARLGRTVLSTLDIG